jgi:hypothetical protein
MFSRRVLWERWLPGSRSEQSSAHVSRLLARGFATLFLGACLLMFSRRVLWERWLPVCDLVSGPVEDRVHLAACLEEAAGQLQVTQDEHQAL